MDKKHQKKQKKRDNRIITLPVYKKGRTEHFHWRPIRHANVFNI